MYVCLLCDERMDVMMFPAHAQSHGWSLDRVRQVGFSWDATQQTATHEFAERGGPSLFYLVRRLTPLVAVERCAWM